MVITQLNGGLGNQMFQYAVGRALQLKQETNLTLDLTHYQKNTQGNTKRKYELNIFTLSDNIKLIAHKKSKYTAINKLTNLLKGFWDQKQITFREDGHQFHPELLQLSGNVALEGYWQSEKYFKTYEKIIRSDFQYRHKASGLNEKLISRINHTNSISIHIRRGDYVSNPSTNKFHGLLGLDYYQAGIRRLENEIVSPSWYIFSDDIDWTKRNIKPKGENHFISQNQKANNWEDLRLMSHCKHNIIANSSFSWWGAWLGKNQDKIVIAPKKWFNDPTINSKDIVPSSWLKM